MCEIENNSEKKPKKHYTQEVKGLCSCLTCFKTAIQHKKTVEFNYRKTNMQKGNNLTAHECTTSINKSIGE